LSYGYWQSRFGQDSGVLNQTMVVNGQAMTIVGVAQRGFEGTSLGLRPQVFVPITMRTFMDRSFDSFADRRHYWVVLFARLKPGTANEQARASLNGQYHALINEVEAPAITGENEQTMAWFKTKPLMLRDGARGQNRLAGTKIILSLLLGLAAFVLVIACANVANILLARGASRAGEIAIRLSIGASRLRVVTQLLTESCLLALFAGGASILVSQWTLDMIASLIPAGMTAPVQFKLSGPAFLFTAILALGTGLLFGLFPALHSARPDLISTLKGQAGKSSETKSAARFRVALATAQIALSLALLVIAGLFTKSLFNVSRISLGIKADQIIAFSISPFRNGYSHEGTFQLFERLEDDLAILPGVTGVANSRSLLLSGAGSSGPVRVDGYDKGQSADMFSFYDKISPAYFRTLGIPLISGREFTRSDVAGAPKVAIVNEAFANKFNLGRDAIGKHMGDNSYGGALLDTEIVGIVQNAKIRSARAASEPMYFCPYRQDPGIEYLNFYVQTSLIPDQVMVSIKKLIARIDPNLPVENLRTIQQQVHDSTFSDRIIGTLSASFACLAILLAAIGIYGVLAYTVAQRTREIGLRLALGSSQAQVRAMMLRQIGLMTIIGMAVGLALGLGFGRVAGNMLYKLQGSDPAVLCGATIVMALVALTAGFIPAHRAAKIDPMKALRYE
jgi:predicted permease